MHPFDFAAESQPVQEGASQPSMSQGSLSQQSEVGAAMVCDRILDGRVDFSYAPWSAMTDGELPLLCLLYVVGSDGGYS